jgi:hypothetical protein
VVQPDSVADDLGGEPVAVVGIGWRLHAAVSPASADAAMPGYRDNADGREADASSCRGTPPDGWREVTESK